jgi:hypothetical protein
VYVGKPEDNPLLLEAKMDWASGLTGRVFIEEKTLRNTKAHKFVIGRLLLDVFDTERLRQMYDEKLPQHVWDDRKGAWQTDKYRKVIGGDQANNKGMLLDWKAAKENSQPFWLVAKQLTQRH